MVAILSQIDFGNNADLLAGSEISVNRKEHQGRRNADNN